MLSLFPYLAQLLYEINVKKKISFHKLINKFTSISKFINPKLIRHFMSGFAKQFSFTSIHYSCFNENLILFFV